MNCSHSLGVAGQPCPFCKQIVPDAYGLSAYAGGANTATPREFVPGVAADREAAGGTSPRVVGSGRGQSTPAPSSTLAAEREPLTPDGDTGQGSLFARGAVPPPAAPRARFTDPVTSHEAARAVTADRQRDAHPAGAATAGRAWAAVRLRPRPSHGPQADFGGCPAWRAGRVGPGGTVRPRRRVGHRTCLHPVGTHSKGERSVSVRDITWEVQE